MPNTENRKNRNKKPTLQEHSQTVIIPQLTPEMLEQARRAAEQGKTAEQIEQEALAAAAGEDAAHQGDADGRCLGYSGFVGCEYRPRGETVAGLGWMKT